MNTIRSLLSVVAISVTFTSMSPHLLSACTILTLVAGDQVWMGTNEDFNKRGAVWFVPASDGKLGRINFGFHDWFGTRENFAQGSMNEKGLAFDAATTPPVSWTADPAKPSPDNLIEEIMDRCESVEQAIEMFRENNCRHLSGGQFMFADATGDSAVIAWNSQSGLSVVRRSGNHQVVTNTHLAPPTYRCARWTRATQVIESDPNPSFDTVRRALEAVHQHGEGFTSYSCIYDLKNRRVSIYNLTNFDEVVTIDLVDQLAKGESGQLLKKWFEHSPRLRDIQSRAQRTDYGTAIQVDAGQLERFAGIYETVNPPNIAVQVKRSGDGLRVINPGQPEATLFAESTTLFRIAPDRGQVSFQLDDQQRVIGLTLHKNIDVIARRVP